MVSLNGVQIKDAGDLDAVLDGTEIVPIQRPEGGAGSTDHTTTQAIADLAGPGGGSGIVETIVAGTNITVDDTDPANPIVSSTAAGGGTPDPHAASHENGGSDELALDASQVTTGTFDDARIPSGVARDSEVTTAITNERTTVATLTNKTLTSPVVNTPTGIVKGDVGLGNVDNTSDANKPVSTAQQTALDLKAPLASPTFTGTVTIPTGASITAPTGLVKGDVGLGNVDNTSNATERAATATLTNKTLTSPVINTPTGIVKGDVGLGNVDNTSDATKNAASVTLTNKTLTSPVLNTGVSGTAIDTDSTMAANSDTLLASQKATKTALALKAPLASPTFTGTPAIAAATGTSLTTTGNITTSAGLFVAGAPNYAGSAMKLLGTIGAETDAALGLIFVGTGFGLGAKLDLRRIGGTFAVPQAVNSGEVICGWHSGACTTDTTTPPVLADVAQIYNVATENFSPTANGNQWEFWTIPNGSTTKALALTIGQDASLLTPGPVIASIDSTSAVASAVIRMRRTRSSGAINNGDAIGVVNTQGHDGTAYGNASLIGSAATQAWTTGAHGSKLTFQTVANGTTALTTALTLDQDQSATLAGALTVTGASTLAALTATGAINFGGGVVTVSSAGIVNFGSGAVVIGSAGNYTSSGFVKSTGTGGVGYATGAGSTATQGTSRTTTVVLNAICGTITLFSATLAADTDVSFTWTNSAIAATDVVVTKIQSGAAVKGGYSVNVICGAGTATVTVHNLTPTITATEAPVIGFAVIKAVTS